MILMDIVMPKMDGLEALKKIKADDRFKKIMVVFSLIWTTKMTKSRPLKWEPAIVDQIAARLQNWRKKSNSCLDKIFHKQAPKASF